MFDQKIRDQAHELAASMQDDGGAAESYQRLLGYTPEEVAELADQGEKHRSKRLAASMLEMIEKIDAQR